MDGILGIISRLVFFCELTGSCAKLYVGLSVTSDLITWHDVVGSICEDVLVVVMMLQI